MKNVVVIEGKIYISASRASKITGYNPDYISQLCRKGVLDSRMVGRSWFVNEDSLKHYKETPLENSATKTVVSKDLNNIVFNAKPQPSRAERINSAQTSYFIEHFGEKPQISAERAIAFLSPNQEIDPVILSHDNRSLISTVGLGLAVVVLLILATSHAITTEQLSFGTSKPIMGSASVIESLGENIGNKAIDAMQAISDVRLDDVKKALVVLPATGNKETNEAMKAYVKNSFSDEVVVTPDSTGNSGVIKPIFKNNDDQEYMYVTVPVTN